MLVSVSTAELCLVISVVFLYDFGPVILKDIIHVAESITAAILAIVDGVPPLFFENIKWTE